MKDPSHLEECNTLIEESGKRRMHWWIKDRCKRSLITSLGEVSFCHTRYVHKERKETAYLLDRMLELPSHTRLSKDAKAELLEEVVQSSYQKAGEILPERVSKQTVKRLVHQVKVVCPPKPSYKEKKEEKLLYVEADEDHVALQFREKKGDVKCYKGKGNNNQIIKLAVVHEGIEKSGSRHKLKNPCYFGGIWSGEKNAVFWRMVEGWIQSSYDEKVLKEIRFQSDGGSWMKQGVEQLQARFVLDGFHLRNYVKRMCRIAEKEEMEKEVMAWVISGQKARIEGWVKEESKYGNEKREKKLKESWNYLKRNWKGVKERVSKKEENIGSSTEAQISHVLSSRMSSRPMGWSRTGADQLAQLRIYWKNGGKIVNLLKKAGEELEQTENEIIFSAKEMFHWEKQMKKSNGKYVEALQAKLSPQFATRFYFREAIQRIC